MTSSLIVLIITAITCSIMGCFLVLRELSMLADAISHTVLLGIVLAFFITHSVTSPLLLVGATIFGVITVAAVEFLGKSRLVKYDDAIAIVFPLFFAIAVILISSFARNAHLDTDMVLMGEVIFASLDSVEVLGFVIPRAAVKISLILLIDIGFIIALFKELNLSAFDEEYAVLIGLPAGILFYLLMTLTSLTAVAAFDAVGSILVLSFFIAPAASAFLLTKSLMRMIMMSVLFAILNCLMGFWLAIHLNASISGMCALVGMLTFLLTLVFQPEGLLQKQLRRHRLKRTLLDELLLVHLGNHSKDEEYSQENQTSTICSHINWNQKKLDMVMNSLETAGYVEQRKQHYVLTKDGFRKYEDIVQMYGLN